MKTLRNIVNTALLSLVITQPVTAEEFSAHPAKKGEEIATLSKKADVGFGDQSGSMEMVLIDKAGRESTRLIRNQRMEEKDDGDKTLIIFDTPKSVAGTKFLSFTHKKGPDDQWLWLPKLNRVKRIASNNKSGPFMGSEFAFEDISSEEVEKYTYKYLRDEKLGENDCWVIERYPLDENSGYSKQVLWIDKEIKYQRQVHFYDKKDTHLKTLVFDGYKKYDDKYWRAGTMSMENHQTMKKSILKWTEYKFNNGFKSGDFTQAALKRVK